MIYIFGDLHGVQNLHIFNKENFPEGYSLTKDDFVIILGDFGIPWSNIGTSSYTHEMRSIYWLSDCPWTTLFVDGNHENFSNLASFEKTEKYGGIVSVLSESVFHLNRGYVYNLENRTFFAFGGGNSIDRVRRIEGLSWWREEIPSNAEFERAMNSLEEHNNNVDYILTHTVSNNVAYDVLNTYYTVPRIADAASDMLDIIEQSVSFKRWFFGHFHMDYNIIQPKSPFYHGLYDMYAKLDTTTNDVTFSKVRHNL